MITFDDNCSSNLLPFIWVCHTASEAPQRPAMMKKRYASVGLGIQKNRSIITDIFKMAPIANIVIRPINLSSKLKTKENKASQKAYVTMT